MEPTEASKQHPLHFYQPECETVEPRDTISTVGQNSKSGLNSMSQQIFLQNVEKSLFNLAPKIA